MQIVTNTIPQYGDYFGIAKCNENQIPLWESLEKLINPQRFTNKGEGFKIKNISVFVCRPCFMTLKTKIGEIKLQVEDSISLENEEYLTRVSFDSDVKYSVKYVY